MSDERWIEMEETFLSNVPRVWLGRKRGFGPDPSVPATEYYLMGYECTRTKRGIRRKHWHLTLHGRSSADLDEQLLAVCDRRDVVVIAEQRRPEYVGYRGAPTLLDMPTNEPKYKQQLSV